MKKATICFLIAVFSGLGPYMGLAGQPDSIRIYTSGITFHHGFILPHRSVVEAVIDERVQGIEIDLGFNTNGRQEWSRAYRYPQAGISFSFWNLGNPAILGDAYGIMPHISFPLTGSKKSELDLKFGWGISYITKGFERLENHHNLTIGSHFNFMIQVFPKFRYRFNNHLTANAGFGLTHFSNGALKMPNLGINVISAAAGLNYCFGNLKQITPKGPGDNFPKSSAWVFYAAGSIKEVYPVLGPRYAALTLFGDRNYRLTRKTKAGFGADLMYDGSDLQSLEDEQGKELSPSKAVKIGIHGSYELVINNLSFIFNMGGYVHANVTTYGRIYHRIGTRYYINNKLFTCLNLKTHWGKADYVEWGIGYQITHVK